MRDNLEELNARELSDIPVLLGGAALTRTYVERDLREVYKGRLFYGKDAFEGLRVMDRLGEIKRDPATDDADWGRVPSDSTVGLRGRFASGDGSERAGRRCPTRSPDVEDDNEIFVPPFTGSKVVKGIALDDIAGVPQRDRAVPQPVAVPPREGRARTTTAFKDRLRPMLREQLAAAGRRICCTPRSSTATGRPTATARTSCLGGRVTRPRDHPLPVPAAAQGAVATASPTSSGRSSRPTSTTSRSTS